MGTLVVRRLSADLLGKADRRLPRHPRARPFRPRAASCPTATLRSSLPRRGDPVVVEAGQQLLALLGRRGIAHVDPGVVHEPERGTGRFQVRRCGSPRLMDRPHRRAQVGTGSVWCASGHSRGATSPRSCCPGCRANQPIRARARSLVGIATGTPSSSARHPTENPQPKHGSQRRPAILGVDAALTERRRRLRSLVRPPTTDGESTMTDTLSSTETHVPREVDPDRLDAFLGQVIGDLGATVSAGARRTRRPPRPLQRATRWRTP